MELLYLEFRKLYANRFIQALFFIVFALNIIVSYYVYQDKGNGRIMYPATAYKQIYADMEAMGMETGYGFLNSALEKLSQSQSPGGKVILEYTNSNEEEMLLLSEVRQNIWQCLHYDEYLSDVEKQAEQTLRFGLVGAFSMRNNQQTIRDVQNMYGRKLEYGPSKGIELYSNILSTDFFVLLFLLAVVVQLVTGERDSRQLILYKTSYKGHMALALAKAGVVMISAVLSALLFWGVNYIMGQTIYGFGGLARPIQSVNSYIGCRFFISIRQFLLLHFGAKILVYLCFCAAAMLVAVKASHSGVMYFVMALICGGCAVCYYGIGSTSRFAFWKYMNLFGFLKSGDIIGTYRNLNVFGVPYSYPALFLAAGVFLVIILFYAAIMLFDGQREAAVCQREKGMWDTPVSVSGRSRFLFVHEAYKLFVNGRVLVVLILYAAFVVMTWKPVTEEFYVPGDVYYDAYIEYLKGPVSDTSNAFINREAKKFERLLMEEAAGKTSNASAYIMQSYDAFMRIKELKTPYLKRTGGEYLHDAGYRLLTGDYIANQKDVKLGLIAVILLIFPLAYIYGMEYQQNTIVLLRSSCRGRGAVPGAKIFLGLLVITVVYLLTYGAFYYRVLAEYGTESIHAPACSLENLENIPAAVSLLQYLVYIAVMRYAGLILVMALLYYLSSKIKSVMGTCVVGILLFILPLGFAYLGIPGADYFLLNPFLLGNVF